MGFENEVEQLNSDLTAMVCRSDSPSHLLRASVEFVYSRYVVVMWLLSRSNNLYRIGFVIALMSTPVLNNLIIIAGMK